MTTNEKKLLSAMQDFQDSYNALLAAIDNYEVEGKTTVNNLHNFVESYPFDKSFDELAVNQWVNDVAEGLNAIEFRILNYTYLNTGGNTMVGIHEVWLPDEKRVVYALTNEEGCTLSVVDYISNELDVEHYDELVIDSVDWGRVTGLEKYFELYRYCLNEYTRDDCRHFGITRQLPYYLLSDALQEEITSDYLSYCEIEHGSMIETNGCHIIKYPDYEEATAEQEWLDAIKSFKRWHDSTAGVEDYYREEYKLSFAGHHITLPFNADVWDAINTALETTIENW